MLIALFPVALHAVYILNDQTWRDNGRILSPEAYCLLFFLVSAWSVRPLRHFVTFLMLILAWQFANLGSQEANAAAMKNIFDLAKINRIVTRIEDIAADLYGQKIPLVIVGNLSFGSDQPPFKKTPNRLYGAQFSTETFVNYRQVPIVNFLLGREVVTAPTELELNAALASEHGRRPWPAPEFVLRCATA